MDNITKSATKIVLLMVVTTLCAIMVYGTVTGQVDYKELTIAFIALLSAVSGFYFAYKGDNNKPFADK